MSTPIQQAKSEGRELFDLGNNTYAEVSYFKGKVYAAIRRWFLADDNNWYRTKNGLTMPIAEFKTLLNSDIEALKSFIDEEESAVLAEAKG